jgi:taurine dioxygenase
MRVKPLPGDPGFGSMVFGLTLDALADDAVRAQLQRLWLQNGVVVFRETDASPRLQIALSRVFGDLEVHSVKELLVDDQPELIRLRTDPNDGNVWEVDGVRVNGFIPWHTDQRYLAAVNRGGILRAAILPDADGETGFIDMISAYERLDDSLKREIEDLQVAYRMMPDDRMFKYISRQSLMRISFPAYAQSIRDRLDTDFPAVSHPLVYVQHETGRKVLNFSPAFASHIIDMEPQKSHALLMKLSLHITDESNAYFHHWQLGDLVLWDNWRVLHQACGVRSAQVREMHRTTISGDYCQGKVIDQGAPVQYQL